MTKHFGAYSRYYDLLYQDKDYVSEAAYVEALLRQHGDDVQSVLELGCGTGRHAELLARQGLDVVGVDLSDTMVEQACDRARKLSDGGGQFAAQQGDVRSFRTDRRFDTVISLFHVVSYQITNQDVNLMFETAATHLKPGGLFVFDVWYGPAVVSDKPVVRVKRMHDDTVDITRIAEPTIDLNRNRVDVHYTILVSDKASGRVTQLQETHPMRYYFAPELELIANQQQLQITHQEAWLTGEPPSDSTWGVCFIARKS